MIEVKKNVPKPVRSPKHRKSKYPFATMDVGDHFHVADVKLSTMKTIAYNFGKRHGLKFDVIELPTGVGVWRDE